MTDVLIDGNVTENREMLHDAFASQLSLPEWYGRNLDALFDCLTDIHEETAVHIVNGDRLKENLGNMYNGLVKVLGRAERENSFIKVYYE